MFYLRKAGTDQYYGSKDSVWGSSAFGWTFRINDARSIAKRLAEQYKVSIEICVPPLVSKSMTYEVQETMPWHTQRTSFEPPLSATTAFLDIKPTVGLTLASNQFLEVKPVDLINNPKHYGGVDDPYETIKVIEAWKLGFCLGNLLKYVSRAGKKNPATRLEDLKKGLWYLQREVANCEKM